MLNSANTTAHPEHNKNIKLVFLEWKEKTWRAFERSEMIWYSRWRSFVNSSSQAFGPSRESAEVMPKARAERPLNWFVFSCFNLWQYTQGVSRSYRKPRLQELEVTGTFFLIDSWGLLTSSLSWRKIRTVASPEGHETLAVNSFFSALFQKF